LQNLARFAKLSDVASHELKDMPGHSHTTQMFHPRCHSHSCIVQRATGATKLNEMSSRSHAVCIIIVEKCTTTISEEGKTSLLCGFSATLRSWSWSIKGKTSLLCEFGAALTVLGFKK
jgi:hypothetical protein